MVLKNGLSCQNASGPFRNGPLELMDLVDGPGSDGPGDARAVYNLAD